MQDNTMDEVTQPTNPEVESVTPPQAVQEGPVTKRLPSISNFAAEVWAIYAKKFVVLTELMLIPALVTFLMLVFKPSIGTSGVYYALMIVSFFIGALAQMAIIYSVAIKNEELNFTASYQKAISNFVPIFIINILYFLAVVGGFILLVIPGLIFMVWFMFSVYVYVFEGVGGVDAMKRSKMYVKAIDGWQLIGYIVVFAIVYILASYAITSIFKMAGISYLIDFATSFQAVILTPLSTICGLVLYSHATKK